MNTKKLKTGTHGQAGQTAIHMDGRGVVATMEAGNEKTRLDDAYELVKRWNAYPDLLEAAIAYRNYLRTAAHTEGEVRTYEHLSDLIAKLTTP